MQKLRKPLSILLSLTIIFSVFTIAPFTASAVSPDDPVDTFGEPTNLGVYTLTNATYSLNSDVVLEGYLYIPSDVTAIIDLNGHTIDRGLYASENYADFIRNEGTLTIKDSVGTGKLTGGYSYQGGVVYNYNSGTLTIEGGTFVENRASQEAGAVYNDTKATLTVTGGKFTNNVSETYGGGAFVNKGTMTLSGGTISGNIAKMDGGGIFNADNATLTVTGGTVTGNCAGAYNSAGNFEGDISADNLLKANNKTRAVTSGLNVYNQSNANIKVFTFASGNTDALVSNSNDKKEVTPNLYSQDHTVDTWDALKTAIGNSSDGDIIMLIGDINNPTENSSDPIVIDNKNITIDLMGHTINRNRTSSHSDGHVIWVEGTSNVKIRDTAGGGSLIGGYATNGGGINVGSNATLNLCNVIVSGNKATEGGGIFVHGTLNIDGAVIFGNTSSVDGGAIHINDDASAVSIKNALITNNSSDSQAGAVYQNNNIPATIENTFIINNSSNDKGGGIYLNKGTVNMTGGTVSGNSSAAGGGVYTINDTIITASGTVFSKNTTTKYGSSFADYSILTPPKKRAEFPFGTFFPPPYTQTINFGVDIICSPLSLPRRRRDIQQRNADNRRRYYQQ